jgi:ribosomal protein S12 methylthiotransferase accessory factor YcaO
MSLQISSRNLLGSTGVFAIKRKSWTRRNISPVVIIETIEDKRSLKKQKYKKGKGNTKAQAKSKHKRKMK